MFSLQAPFLPSGDQPQAIAALIQSIETGQKMQGLKGVTGSAGLAIDGKNDTLGACTKLRAPTLYITRYTFCCTQSPQQC